MTTPIELVLMRLDTRAVGVDSVPVLVSMVLPRTKSGVGGGLATGKEVLKELAGGVEEFGILIGDALEAVYPSDGLDGGDKRLSTSIELLSTCLDMLGATEGDEETP